MELKLVRKSWGVGVPYTAGELLLDGTAKLFDTLEDRTRAPGVKVAGDTCIPAGKYRVELAWSPSFKRELPHVYGVTGFDGILLHRGNTTADTRGCVLVAVGWRVPGTLAATSKLAEEALVALLRAHGGKATLEVVYATPPAP